jgi:phospholipase C
VVSPFSTGANVCSDGSDHTSQLRFLERRFGVDVPGTPLSLAPVQHMPTQEPGSRRRVG